MTDRKEVKMMEKDNCEIYCYNEDVVKRVRTEIDQEEISERVRLFKAIADENRAKIAFALTKETELCVCDMAHIIGSSVATASHHARTLKKMGLTRLRKEGKLVFYSFKDENLKQLLVQLFMNEKKVKING